MAYQGRDAVIVGAVRTPVGKGKASGALHDVLPADLLAHSLRELVQRTGVFAGGSSGATYVAASWVAEHYEREERVVAILPDRGDRYYASIYSPEFMRKTNLSDEIAAACPMPITYGVDVAKRWSYSPIPHDRSSFTGDVCTTEEFAKSLGLDAVHTHELHLSGK